jgi:hypothetical protein
MSGPANFIPASNVVTAITNALNTLVTTQTPHGYSAGFYVRLYIPNGFGMPQANGVQTLIQTVPTPTTFTCDLNSLNFYPFTVPGGAKQSAQVVYIGEVSSLLTGSKRNIYGNPIDIPF